jgi:hypothetical protein
MEQLGRGLPPPRHETRCPREAPPDERMKLTKREVLMAGAPLRASIIESRFARLSAVSQSRHEVGQVTGAISGHMLAFRRETEAGSLA